MASPSATVLCTAAGSFRLAPNMVVLFFLAALLATPLATPTRSSSPSSNGASLQQPTATFCSSGQSPAVTSSEVTRFLAAVCAGAYGVAHMSHNMSSYVVAQNRTMYGVAQCHPDVSVADCAACLTAASKLIIAGTAAEGLVYGLTRCAAGISCADCRRCLRGALQVVDREYNGSAGMQVLRLSCMARYESYPFYNTKSLARLLLGITSATIRLNASASRPAATPAVPAPPGGRNPPPPSPPAQARAPPPAASRTTIANATVGFPPWRSYPTACCCRTE